MVKLFLVLPASLCLLGGAWRLLLAAGCAGQVVYLAMRGLALGRLPLLGPHDTLVFYAASVSLMALCAACAPSLKGERRVSAVCGAVSAGVTLCALLFPPLDMPLPQILDTAWFELHVVLAFFAYGLFTVGGVLGGAQLAGLQRIGMDVQYKIALAGWAFFSGSMITGGIWGYFAWGTYWLWTPKELWTSILWLYYALLVHLRLKGAPWERAYAWMSLAGVGVMLFTYLGVSMLMKSSHSF